MAVYALAALLLFRMLTLDLSNESSATGRKTARGIRSATWSAKRGAHGCVSSAREQQRDRESKNVPRLASRCPRWTPRCSPARTCSRCPRSSRATAVTSRRSSTAKHPPPSAARTGWSGIQTPKGSGNGFCRRDRRVGRGGAPRSLVAVASESEENLLGGARDPLRARRGCALDGRVPGKKAGQGLAWPRGVVWPVARSRRSFQRHIVRRLISRIGLLSRNVGNLDQNRRITCLAKIYQFMGNLES